MAKVWILEDLDHGDSGVYLADKPAYEIPFVARELEYLVGGYDDEREEFIKDVDRAISRGRGSARIEERLVVTLTEPTEF